MPSKAALVDRELNVDSERKAERVENNHGRSRSIEKTRQREYEKTQPELNVLMALSKLLTTRRKCKKISTRSNSKKRGDGK